MKLKIKKNYEINKIYTSKRIRQRYENGDRMWLAGAFDQSFCSCEFGDASEQFNISVPNLLDAVSCTVTKNAILTRCKAIMSISGEHPDILPNYKLLMELIKRETNQVTINGLLYEVKGNQVVIIWSDFVAEFN